MLNKTIKEVTYDIAGFKYNTAIAKLMEYYNELNLEFTKNGRLDYKYIKTLVVLLAPFAPHMTEELWQRLISVEDKEIASLQAPRNDSFNSIHLHPWPQFDASKIEVEEVIIVVQINGKKRGEINISSSEINQQEEIEVKARALASKYLEGQTIKKTIYIPGKIINFVV